MAGAAVRRNCPQRPASALPPHNGASRLARPRGSGGIANFSMSIFGYERNQQGERPDLTRIRILKNRWTGWTGVADVLRWDETLGRQIVTDEACPDNKESASSGFGPVEKEYQMSKEKLEKELAALRDEVSQQGVRLTLAQGWVNLLTKAYDALLHDGVNYRDLKEYKDEYPDEGHEDARYAGSQRLCGLDGPRRECDPYGCPKEGLQVSLGLV